MQPGQVIAHYRLTSRIGRDNDTVIYRARDLRLERDVAIKLLLPERPAGPEVRERFRREAQIASLVSHPHVCAVHDSGEEHGQAFTVCELLEGQALDELLAAGRLTAERALDLAIQLVDGVAAIHRRGLVHGNLKPSNVFVTDDGLVKLLELGVMSAWWEAIAADPALDSSSPTASMTRRVSVDHDPGDFHSYCSPEQLAGEPVDHRSDIFSLGAVLYEMVSGDRAFPGETPSRIAAAIVGGQPAALDSSPHQALPIVQPVVYRALEKAADDRYQHAGDLLAELRRARRRLDSSGEAPPWPGRRMLWRSIAAAVLVLVGAAGMYWWWTAARTAAPVARHGLLVGSVANGTNDPDFDGTLRQALIVHLAQSPFLEVVTDERIREILRMMGRQPDTALTHTVAAEACQRIGVSAMIEGSVSAVGRATVVALVATDCGSGDVIARDQVEVERKEEVLSAVGRIASELRRSLGESVTSLERHNVPIEEATTPSLEALKAYTAGVEERAAGNELESIPFLVRAVELDPRFALAYTTLSSIYGGLGETGTGERYAQLAYDNRDSVSERERLFIAYQYHDRVTGDQLKAREALEVWKRSYPLDYRAPNALAVLLNRLGDYEAAMAEGEAAMALNPAHPFPYSNLAYAYRGAGRFEESAAVASKAVSLGIETLPTRRLLYQLAEMSNDPATARQHLEWARSRPRGFDLTGAKAQVLAYRGEMDAARQAYAETLEAATRSRLPQIASGYASQLALTEALYGFAAQATAVAGRVTAQTADEPQLRAATALALAGAPGEAEAVIRRLADIRPSDTFIQTAYLPIARAATALSRGRFEATVDALRPAAPIERGTIAALLPMYLRGTARFRDGQFDAAVREFRTVLETRGADPFSPILPLARLGLARALAGAGDPAASRAAYTELLAIWAGADADFPLLREARDEADPRRLQPVAPNPQIISYAAPRRRAPR